MYSLSSFFFSLIVSIDSLASSRYSILCLGEQHQARKLVSQSDTDRYVAQVSHPTMWKTAIIFPVSSLKFVMNKKWKQGRIHGYPSRVRVDRGNDEFDQPSSWAGAVTPKPPINAKKAKCYRPADLSTDRLTDRSMDRAGCRVACTRLKKDR